MGDEFVAAIIAGMVGTIIAVGIQSTMDDKKGKVKRNKVIRVKTDCPDIKDTKEYKSLLKLKARKEVEVKELNDKLESLEKEKVPVKPDGDIYRAMPFEKLKELVDILKIQYDIPDLETGPTKDNYIEVLKQYSSNKLRLISREDTTTPEEVQQGADQPVDDRRRGELLALTNSPTTTPEAVQQGADQPVDDRRRGELLALTILQPLHQRRYNKVLINLWMIVEEVNY